MATPLRKPPESPPPTRARRLTLASVESGAHEVSDSVLLYGVEGIGKSTWGAGAPSPIFLAGEDGQHHLDVPRFPQVETWPDVFDAIDELERGDHRFGTLVVDTLDSLEPLLWAYICERDKQPSIEAYGYGKGYVAAVDEWRRYRAATQRLRRARPGFGVVELAHSHIRTFRNPEGDDFDRYSLKLNEKAAALLKETTDCVLFATYETFAVTKEKRTRGVSTGARVVHTTRTAAWDAKNRFDLPETLPLTYDEYAAAKKAHRPADPAAMKTEIAALVAQVDEATKATAETYIAKAGNDPALLAKTLNWLRAKAPQGGN